MADAPFGRFFLPGPTEVRPEILAAMARPMIPHRGEEAAALYRRIQEGLRPLFRTARPVYVGVSSATGMMEAGVRALPPGRLLALVNGAFSERFARIGEACGFATDVLAHSWGAVHDPSEVARRLSEKRYVALLVVHSETSTGALQPVAKLAAVARTAGAAILVDAVTSLCATPVLADAWELDYVLSSSQKALALPPGIAFAVAGATMLERAASAERRGLYLDLLDFEKCAAAQQPSFTPALPLLYALDVQLGRIAAETLEARWNRHIEMAARTWRWAEESEGRVGVRLEVLAPAGFRSPSVSCLRLPPGLVGPAVVKAVAARGFTLGQGYGPLKETTFRIGHMGDHTLRELEELLAACDQALATLGKR
ncbi:MAG: pyridoxal-phosphate-dependent aminotransferase family protein [Planctomycetaceae bacterium]